MPPPGADGCGLSSVIATAVEADPGTRIYDKADTEVQERLAALAAQAS
ncbi:hypothetical protein [Nocardia sp. NPDC059154]